MKASNLLTVFFSLFFAFGAWSQARINFQGDPGAYIVIEDGAYLVIGNGNANAITNPENGNIVSEDEFDYVKWNIGTNDGMYTVPFTTGNNDKIPLEVNITSAGSGGSDPGFLFSTYGGLGSDPWDSDVNKPTIVQHTYDIATGSVNNSPFVIDRFWIIDADGYGTKPTATLSIGYADEEHEANDNTITESALGGQRYNSDEDIWGDYLPQGTADIANDVVTGIPAPAADFYRVWTLVSNEMPLPVELTNLAAQCKNGAMQITWATQSEHNNDYFLIERSANGNHWQTLTEVAGSGNSSVEIRYEAYDETPLSSTTYYRITQVDYNGDSRIYGPVAGTCSDYDLDIVSVMNNFDSDQLLMNVSSSINSDFQLYVLDMSGKVLIAEQGVAIRNGMNQVKINKSEMSMGIYIIQLVNDNHLLTRKVAIN